MCNHNWLTWPLIIWLLTCCYFLVGIDGQSENAIGAHRVFEKTSFSCAGRPAGYYADIETGCQVYHMCDGLGRQFSYSCPNTTLFQQRMLICDHWYMVNCSRAESDYAANLLIGQRDKPFVNDEENSLRTPRPDLLDRPYAPDYSGESFRNQYKQLPAIQNQIQDTDAQKFQDKLNTIPQAAPGQQHWKIPSPSRTILPPAYEAQTTDDRASQTNSDNVRFVPKTAQPTASSKQTKTTFNRPTPSSVSASTQVQPINRFNNAALHQRGQSNEPEDLGTSHSTRYNTSADFNSAEQPNSKTASVSNKNKISSSFGIVPPATASTTTTTTRPVTPTASSKLTTSSTSSAAITTNLPIKIPSKVYEPPYVYPIYNENETVSTQLPLRASSATPFTVSPTLTRLTSTTPVPPPSRPTTLAGKPFAAPSSGITTKAPNFGGRSQNNLIQNSFTHNSKDVRTPTPAQGFKPPTPRPLISTTTSATKSTESSPFDYSIPTTNRLHLPTPIINTASSTNTGTAAATGSDATPPSKELLPPYQEFVQHDIATTQGPPIYYEWKVPSNGLEPPKLDPPIGVDGREYPEPSFDYNTISGASEGKNTQTAKSNSSPTDKVASDKSQTARTPISRSIKETGQPNSVHRVVNVESTKATSTTTPVATDRSDTISAPTSDITQLRRDYSVPEYLFPLESAGRTGYLSTDSYNSFRLKIPEHGEEEIEDHRHWFGENPKCPECHPSFVVPGTCEPCIRR
ncbi:mucin-5AC [Ceratitis capitata]|uniref:mucin-5AC n=1 Tax=Ceratitis capitata TaxID=7213 RepID=UPI00061892F9|nr:mucin-5AC [Ceratitis capitata]XP_012157265.1 mucin-5AC [Ceratitis capitata]XP_012157266.1 mucin-5AC [Ceratitis capitata]XP_012157267.1 mucin-5AC [Ceratitis capitata]XP_020714880.1 mucin-5AC [Ceratitis capitata]